MDNVLNVLERDRAKGLDTWELCVYQDKPVNGSNLARINPLNVVVPLLHLLPNLRILTVDVIHNDFGKPIPPGSESQWIDALKGLKWMKQLSLPYYPAHASIILELSQLTANMPCLLSLDIGLSGIPRESYDNKAPDLDVDIPTLRNISINDFSDAHRATCVICVLHLPRHLPSSPRHKEQRPHSSRPVIHCHLASLFFLRLHCGAWTTSFLKA